MEPLRGEFNRYFAEPVLERSEGLRMTIFEDSLRSRRPPR